MKKINKYIFLMVVAVVFFFTACDEDDNTGASGIIPTNPTISVDIPAGGVDLLEKKTTYLFDITLSETQVVDISIYISVIAGTATEGDDFTIDNGNSRVNIAAGKTTGTVSITVLEDELLEETETFTIQIGDERTANAVLAPVTVDFTLTNLTANDLVAGLSWETNVEDVIGLGIDADEVVDLRFLILDADGVVVETVDGDSFEDYTFVGADLDDGVYTLAVDILETIDAGGFDAPVNLDLTLQFDQVGTINAQTLVFDDVMTNGLVGDAYQVKLATVTKSGSSYSIEESVSYFVASNNPLVGDYSGDDAGYESIVKTMINGDIVQITGLNNEWMLEDWGETVQDVVYVDLEIGFGTIVIPEQDYFTTDYNGKLFLYQIKGTGTYSVKGGVTTLSILYELIQDGFNVNEYVFGTGETFEATLTFDVTD